MSNDAILILGEDDEICDIPQETTPQEYLTVDGSLKEIADSNSQALARTNLDVYSKSEVNDIKESIVSQADNDREQTKAITDGLKQNLENIEQTQDEFVKKDGSTPFESIQEGVTPSDNVENALVTVRYILNKLKSYSTTSDANKTLEDKLAILDNYALLSDVYKKSNTYCKAQINNLLESYVKADGTTPFKYPQEGQYPKLRPHLSTKGYVDDIIKQHKNELDPHNFQAILNQKLANYYKKSETYTKAQTYSRLQLDQIIDQLVSDACKSLIEEHLNTTQHLTSQDVQRIIKQYSVNNLVTKEDLEESLLETKQELSEIDPIWKTSGPVLTTVGFVEDNTELPTEMTMQEILDSIFYGAKISIHTADRVQIGGIVDVTVCLHGGARTNSIILYQDDVVLEQFTDADFADSCVTVQSNPITADTTFRFVVLYANGLEQEVTATVRAIAPIFVGLLPKWKFGNTITTEYLNELVAEDPDNNRFVSDYEEFGDITQSYNFKDASLRHILLAVPTSHSDLKEITTSSQRFGIDAFDIINIIPFQIEHAETDIMYKLYIYRQALSSINQDVTFKFTSKE